MPSLDEVTMKPCVVWKVAMSVMMSWCPTGSDSGPRRGESSTTPLFCLLWISCRDAKMVFNLTHTHRGIMGNDPCYGGDNWSHFCLFNFLKWSSVRHECDDCDSKFKKDLSPDDLSLLKILLIDQTAHFINFTTDCWINSFHPIRHSNFYQPKVDFYMTAECVPVQSVYLGRVCTHLYNFSSFDDLPAVEDRRTVQRVIGSSRHDVRPLRIRQIPEPENHPKHFFIQKHMLKRVMITYLLPGVIYRGFGGFLTQVSSNSVFSVFMIHSHVFYIWTSPEFHWAADVAAVRPGSLFLSSLIKLWEGACQLLYTASYIIVLIVLITVIVKRKQLSCAHAQQHICCWSKNHHFFTNGGSSCITHRFGFKEPGWLWNWFP